MARSAFAWPGPCRVSRFVELAEEQTVGASRDRHCSRRSASSSTTGQTLLRLGYDSHIGLWRLPAAWIGLLRILVRHGRHNDDVLPLFPVHGSRDLVLGRELAGV